MTNIYVILLVLKILWCDVFFVRFFSVAVCFDSACRWCYQIVSLYASNNSGSFPFLWYFICADSRSKKWLRAAVKQQITMATTAKMPSFWMLAFLCKIKTSKTQAFVVVTEWEIGAFDYVLLGSNNQLPASKMSDAHVRIAHHSLFHFSHRSTMTNINNQINTTFIHKCDHHCWWYVSMDVIRTRSHRIIIALWQVALLFCYCCCCCCISCYRHCCWLWCRHRYCLLSLLLFELYVATIITVHIQN